ncbi:MAG: aldehyde dehydrogenase (NADP(+)) [Acidobacteria bacterium]|nr:MAG: aldehyde dehydrogenase (NADP(+)) [Acidobacteriota bacterium]
MVQLSGKSLIGLARGSNHGSAFRGINPATGEQLAPAYFVASEHEVDRSVVLAAKAFEVYRNTPAAVKAAFLRSIAINIEELNGTLVKRAVEETALPAARISGEIVRTCSQLRLFADMVEEGSWVDARIDRADPTRKPLPRPDVRSMYRPLGPVAVFCASNFPLAFSVAGGDTASALAAGNTVVVKAHHSHPGTAELVGLAVSAAVTRFDLPEGIFSLLFGPGNQVGAQLLSHPSIKAAGFTGSRSGGQALMKVAASRAEPIPFHAEMSSVNPVVIFPGALREREDNIVSGLYASVTLGAGQFCTNPGLIFIPSGADGFISKLTEKMMNTPGFTMLNSQISRAYRQGLSKLSNQPAIKLFSLTGQNDSNGCECTAAFAVTDSKSFLSNPILSKEIFGPATLLVTYSDIGELSEVAQSLEGQLTATVHATEVEVENHRDLLTLLETRASRLILNGFPTGVEVCHSMVHGGPSPATSDGRFTSVGTRAVLRFVRPICYQDWPNPALPDELKNENPLAIWRLVDGELTREPLNN